MFQPLAESVHYIHILYIEQEDNLEDKFLMFKSVDFFNLNKGIFTF